MSAKIERLIVLLVFSLCMLSLSFHFIVEGLGGVHDHLVGRQTTSAFHSHDGDLFMLGEPWIGKNAQPVSRVAIISDLNAVSQPLPPLFHPPKSF
jgi:hypothetical protein